MRVPVHFSVFTFMLAAASSSVVADTVQADDVCVGVDTDMTEERVQEYSELIVSAISDSLEPSDRFETSDVQIFKYMESGNWSVVSSAIPTADSAMLFFERTEGDNKFVDAWGGWADPSERNELIQWAENLGAPMNLARCFAHEVVDGDEVDPIFGFSVDLNFTESALTELAELNEQVTVLASFYAEPTVEGEGFTDEVGHINLGSEGVQVPAESGIVPITGNGADSEKLQWIDGDINVNVNVFTSRLSGDLNLISCDLIDGPISEVITEMPVALNCALIEEGIASEVRP